MNMTVWSNLILKRTFKIALFAFGTAVWVESIFIYAFQQIIRIYLRTLQTYSESVFWVCIALLFSLLSALFHHPCHRRRLMCVNSPKAVEQSSSVSNIKRAQSFFELKSFYRIEWNHFVICEAIFPSFWMPYALIFNIYWNVKYIKININANI